MATEVLNAVSPWMGKLLWVDSPRSGKSKKGNDWKSVDFVLDYTDPQGNNDLKILFSVFGAEKVDKILSAKTGDTVKVLWRPSAREYNGKWYCKFDAYDVTVYEEKKQTDLPKSAPSFTAKQEEDLPDDQGFPF